MNLPARLPSPISAQQARKDKTNFFAPTIKDEIIAVLREEITRLEQQVTELRQKNVELMMDNKGLRENRFREQFPVKGR